MKAKKTITELFKEGDADKDGFISDKELKEFLKKNDKMSYDWVREKIFKEVDANKDGKISEKELKDKSDLVNKHIN